MKKIILLILGFAVLGHSYMALVDCSYSYNQDFNESGYTGLYRGSSGQYYSYWFKTPVFSWCPYNI